MIDPGCSRSIRHQLLRTGVCIVLLAEASLGIGSSTATAAGDYFPPPESEGGWRKNTDPDFVRSLGLDPERLEAFGRYNLEVPNGAWEPYSRYKGVIVIKDGWIVGEWYNVPEARDFRSYISSNGKTFALCCFGAMVKDSREGKIPYRIDANSRVYDRRWLPDGFPLSDPRKAEITFEHIFRHTSGLCPERGGGGVEIEKGRDKWTDYKDWVLGHDRKWPVTGQLAFDPGKPEQWTGAERSGMLSWGYSSVGFAHIGLVLRNVCGEPADRFLWERICRPIGFGGLEFHAPPSDSIRWFSAGGVRITPRDYARFAWFLEHDGRWGDNRILPKGWLQPFRSSAMYPNMLSNAEGGLGPRYPRDMFRIAGSGLNWAYIVPSLDLIALRVARGNNEMWDEVTAGFLEKLFAAVNEK